MPMLGWRLPGMGRYDGLEGEVPFERRAEDAKRMAWEHGAEISEWNPARKSKWSTEEGCDTELTSEREGSAHTGDAESESEADVDVGLGGKVAPPPAARRPPAVRPPSVTRPPRVYWPGPEPQLTPNHFFFFCFLTKWVAIAPF